MKGRRVPDLLRDYQLVLNSIGDHQTPTVGRLRAYEHFIRIRSHILQIDPSQLLAQQLAQPPDTVLHQDADRFVSGSNVFTRCLLRVRHSLREYSQSALLLKIDTCSPIHSVVGYTHDAEPLAMTGHEDGVVRTYQLMTADCIAEFPGHTGPISALTITPNHTYAMSGSEDGSLRIWNVREGKLTHTLGSHDSAICAIALSPDCRHALSCSFDGVIRCWDIQNGTHVEVRFEDRHFRKRRGYQARVVAAVILEAGAALTLHANGALYRWDIRTCQFLELRVGESYPQMATLAADGNRMLELTRAGFNWRSLSALATADSLEWSPHSVHSMALSSDGNRALSGGRDGSIHWWELKTARHHSGGRRVHPGWVAALWSDGRYALSGDALPGASWGALCWWDLDAPNSIDTKRTRHRYQHISISRDGQHGLCYTRAGYLRWYNLEYGRCLRNVKAYGHRGWLHGLVLAEDGYHAMTYGSYRVRQSNQFALNWWDLRTGCTQLIELPKGTTMAGSGNYVVTGDPACLLKWDIRSGEILSTLRRDDTALPVLAVTSGCSGVFAAYRGGTVVFWDCESGRVQECRAEGMSAITVATVTLDGRNAVAGHEDGTLSLWQLKTLRCIRLIEAHRGIEQSTFRDVRGMTALAGKNTVVSWTSISSRPRIWDLETGSNVRTLDSSRSHPPFALASDGQHAVACDGDTIRFLDMKDHCGNCLAAFTFDVRVTCIAVSGGPPYRVLVAGDDGQVYSFDILR